MAFVSKSRKVRFSLHLHIHDLNNVPLVSGTSLIKWHLPTSTSAEHRGRTSKSPIKDHRVTYNYSKSTTLRLTVSKNGQLQECGIDFEVQQEYSAGGRGERITLGKVRLNLAEYVNVSEPMSPGKETGEEGGGITRRYLMQESKINSTLKIGIRMVYLEGTREYYAPALRSAPVFGGIAGIISSSDPAAAAANAATSAAQHSEAAARGGGEDDEGGGGGGGLNGFSNFSMSNNNDHSSSNGKELGELQDMYRKTLSAYWSSQPGELKADECIEDIFAGGDGWGKGGRPLSTGLTVATTANHHGSSNIGGGSRPGSGSSTPNHPEDHHHHLLRGGDGGRGGNTSSSSSSVGTILHSRHDFSRNHQGHHHTKQRSKMTRGADELDEMDVREDLRSWRIGEAARS